MKLNGARSEAQMSRSEWNAWVNTAGESYAQAEVQGVGVRYHIDDYADANVAVVLHIADGPGNIPTRWVSFFDNYSDALTAVTRTVVQDIADNSDLDQDKS